MLGGPQSRSGGVGEENNLPMPGMNPGLSTGTQSTLLTELFRFPGIYAKVKGKVPRHEDAFIA